MKDARVGLRPLEHIYSFSNMENPHLYNHQF